MWHPGRNTCFEIALTADGASLSSSRDARAPASVSQTSRAQGSVFYGFIIWGHKTPFLLNSRAGCGMAISDGLCFGDNISKQADQDLSTSCSSRMPLSRSPRQEDGRALPHKTSLPWEGFGNCCFCSPGQSSGENFTVMVQVPPGPVFRPTKRNETTLVGSKRKFSGAQGCALGMELKLPETARQRGTVTVSDAIILNAVKAAKSRRQ